MKEFLKLSRLFCICLASITSASAGAADWRLAEVGDSAAMYVDVESIRRDASKVWFWAQTLMIPEVFEQNPRESRHLYAANCRMMEYKVIAGRFITSKRNCGITTSWLLYFQRILRFPEL